MSGSNSSTPSTPVFAPVAGNSSTSIGSRSRRPSSIISGTSSLSATAGGAGSLSTFTPVGLNRVGHSLNRLGSNSIADLVDGNNISVSNDPYASPAQLGRRNMNTGGSSSFPFKPPTSKDIPPVTLAPTPRIKKEELREKLNDISSEYELFYGARISKGAGSTGLEPTGSKILSDDTLSLLSDKGVSMSVSSNDGAAIISDSESIADGDDSGTRQDTPDLTPLSTIPEVFFQEKFQLDNPKVFGIVSEKSEIIQGNGGSPPPIKVSDEDYEGTESDVPKILASNSILQEKLSWYIDTVELHLINEISNASKSFFSTLGDLKTINERASECITRIQYLKEQLVYADKDIALHGIEQVKLRQRRQNVEALSESLLQIATVFEQADNAESILLEGSDVDQSLDIIDASEALLEGNSSNDLVSQWITTWSYPLVDLRSVHGLADLRENLCTLRSKAGDIYSNKFSDILLKDLQTHMDSVPKVDTLQRLGKILDGDPAANTSYLKDTQLRESLIRQLRGLERSDNIATAFNQYKESVVKMVKNVVRMNLPSKSDTVSMSSNSTNRSMADKSMSLATSLRAMTIREAETMVSDIYISLSELYRRLSAQQKLLLDLTASLDDSKGTAVIDLSDLLLSVINHSESRMTKVLKVRREQTVNYGLQDFINFYALNGIYLAECELICGDPSNELRGMLSVFIKQFLDRFYAKHESELAELMDKDLWREEEITKDFQALVDRIVESGKSGKDPAPWVAALRKILSPTESEDDIPLSRLISSGVSTSEKKLPRNVFVENSSFIISKAAICLIRFTEDYLKLMILLPHLSTEVVTNWIDLAKKFNSRAIQLILGAGATRSAGLKHITAKHLALSSESVNIVVALLPFIKSFAARHLAPTSPVLNDFDALLGELENHRHEVHQKFVSLMSDKMNLHYNAIMKTDWSIPGPVSKYMQDLVKETSILVKILSKILPKQSYLVSICNAFA
ncbi:Vps54p [Sugiyamaella lignohabitans]|uniref:Vps54p n=1 Tax=Sugiyamaella lignohabitans TaxID=796027 RepID=A0A167DUU9_9ASCO|nr:Vps54p [Sugiyamaella lignohabitans]ANB13318.1 Vps54p [Sugiyamaella lignohabitans]